MYFDFELLVRPESPLSLPWIVSTRGLSERAIKKRIAAADVRKICDVLRPFMISTSTNPRKRFSLKLSAMLISGTVKIYNQQVIMLEATMSDLYAKHPKRDAEDDMPSTPVQKVRKVKDAKKAVEQTETPESLIEALGTSNVVARVEDITLRDEVPTRLPTIEDDFAFGDLGMLPWEQPARAEGIDKEKVERTVQHPVRQTSSTSEEDPQAPQRIVVEAVIEHTPPDGRLMPPPTEHIEQLPLEPVEQMPLEPIEPMPLETVEQMPSEPVQETHLEPLDQIAPVPVEMDVDAPVEEPVRRPPAPLGQLQTDEVEVRTQRGKKKAGISNLFIKYKAVKSVIRTYRCPPREEDIIRDTSKEEDFKLLKLNLKQLKKDFGLDIEDIEPGEEVRRAASSKISGPERSIEGMRPPVTVETPEIQIPMGVTVEETPSIDQQAQRRSADVIGLEAAGQETPRKRPKLTEEPSIPVPIDILQEMPEVPFIPQEQLEAEVVVQPVEEPMEVHTAQAGPVLDVLEDIPEYTPKRLEEMRREKKKEERTRQQIIVNLVSDWNYTTGDLTIDDVCKHIFGKLNRICMARSFSDLLNLCKNGFVRLHSHPDSTEFKSITKGPKFT